MCFFSSSVFFFLGISVAFVFYSRRKFLFLVNLRLETERNDRSAPFVGFAQT